MIHHVYANQSNVGDWLSARGIQALLAPRPVREHFCDAPFVPVTLAALEAAGPEDFIVIGGGGLLADYFTPFWEGFQSVAARVPFAIWGVGACDLKREPSRAPAGLLQAIAARSRLCVVRDDLTREILGGSAALPPVICPTVVPVATTPLSSRGLLVVDHYDTMGPENYERMVAESTAFAASTGRTCHRTNNLIARRDEAQLRRVLGLYAGADLVVSSRLHGCIIALAMGRRLLAISGDRKIEAFMRGAGMSEWVVDIGDLPALPERLAAVSRQAPPTAYIEEGRRRNQAIAAQIAALLPGGTGCRVSTLT